MSEKSKASGRANLLAASSNPEHQSKAGKARATQLKEDQASWHRWWKNGHMKPSVRRKRRRVAKKQWKDPLHRAKMIAILAKENEKRYGPPVPEKYKKEYKRLRSYFGAEQARKLINELIEKDKEKAP